MLSVLIVQPYGKSVTPSHTPPVALSSWHNGSGSLKQLLAPLMVHELKSEKHMEPSWVGCAFSWYAVGHIQVKPAGPAWPPAQKPLSCRQRYCSGVRLVLSHATPRSAGSKLTPLALQPLRYMLPGGGSASHASWLAKHWNSLPWGRAPAGICSATQPQTLSAAVGSHIEPKASAMPLPHQVRSFAQRLPPSSHGFSPSASQASCEP